MRVLITGSAGFVGSHLVEYLLDKTNWEIIGLDSFRHKGDSLRVSNNPRYTIHCHDLKAPLARPRMFIQVSTDEVYGAAPLGESFSEWAPIVPSNPYSASKAAQEAIAISYWRTYGVPLVITNTMNMFGERQDPEKYIPMLISKISKGQDIQVHGTEDHIGTRFYLHAKNFADALFFLMTKTEARVYEDSSEVVIPSRYNVVGVAEVDNLEIAKMVAALMDKPLIYKLTDFHHTRPGHDRRYALDGKKLESAGWKQDRNLEASLQSTIEWTLAHPEWMS